MKLLIQLILFSLVFSCSSQNKFKKGNFELVNKEANLRFEIYRDNYRQIEKTFTLSDNKFQKETLLYITWITNKEYILKFDSINAKIDSMSQIINNNGGLKNQIIEIHNNCSFVKTKFKNDSIISQICIKK